MTPNYPVTGAVGLTRRTAWVRVPVVVVEGLIILSGLVTVVQAMLAGVAPTGFIGIILAILVLRGCFSRESSAWLQARDEPDQDPRAERRDVAREP